MDLYVYIDLYVAVIAKRVQWWAVIGAAVRGVHAAAVGFVVLGRCSRIPRVRLLL